MVALALILERRPWIAAHREPDGMARPFTPTIWPAGLSGEVHAFIHGMAEAYRAADLVLCRAGALTVSELSMSSRGSVLVPYPHAIYNHQELNAKALVDAGAGEMILEKDLTPQVIADTLARLDGDRKSLQQMAWKAGTLARPEAATEVVDEMYRLLGRP